MSARMWIVLCLAAPLVAVALGARLVALVELARERRRHARVLEGLGAPVPPAELVGIVARSVVTLEGTLVCDPATAGLVSFHPYGTSFLDEPNVYAITQSSHATSIAVELDGGGRAQLEGQMQVLAGSMESEHSAPLERAGVFGAEELAAAKVRTRVGQFRSLRNGDRVRVRGAAEPAPDDDALYRARSRVLRVSPAVNDSGVQSGAITVAATDRALRRTVGARRALWIAVGSAVVLGGSMSLITGFPSPSSPTTPQPTSSGGPGAAGPPACRAGVLAKLEANRPLEAATEARTCDDAYASAYVHYANADFREASAAFASASAKEPGSKPSLTEVETHLFAHELERAAGVVHRMVAQFYSGPATAESRYLDCISGILDDRARQGDGGPGPFITKPPNAHYRKICSSRPFAKLARELDAEGGYYGEEDWLEFSSHKYYEGAAYDPVGQPFTAVVGARARLAARPVGVERSLLDRLLLAPGPGRPGGEPGPYGRLDLFRGWEESLYPLLTTFAAELTLFYAYAGFPERCGPYWPILDRVATLLEAVPPRSFHTVTTTFAWEKQKVEDEKDLLTFVMSVAASAALLADDPVRVKRYAALGEVHSARIVTQLQRAQLPSAAWEEPPGDGQWPEHKALFDAGRTGDAANVARVLTQQRSTGRATLARILPQLRTNRPELDRWLKNAFPSPCLTCGASAFHGHVSDRREVARLLGDTREAEALRPVAARFTDALTDVAIAFELDELETFFAPKR